MLVIIEVAEDDIQHGQANDCYHCPVARAVDGVIHERLRARVSGRSIQIGSFEKMGASTMFIRYYSEDVPRSVYRFVFNFDTKLHTPKNAEKCKPFKFRMDIPAPFLRSLDAETTKKD